MGQGKEDNLDRILKHISKIRRNCIFLPRRQPRFQSHATGNVIIGVGKPASAGMVVLWHITGFYLSFLFYLSIQGLIMT